jgi:predicted  nucleic acid-binding Zn-ribbon protein
LAQDITRTEEGLQFNQQRITQLNDELTQTQQRSEEAGQQVENDNQQIQSMRAQVTELQPRTAALAAADESVQSALAQAEKLSKDWQQRWDEFNQAFASNEQEAQVRRQK